MLDDELYPIFFHNYTLFGDEYLSNSSKLSNNDNQNIINQFQAPFSEFNFENEYKNINLSLLKNKRNFERKESKNKAKSFYDLKEGHSKHINELLKPDDLMESKEEKKDTIKYLKENLDYNLKLKEIVEEKNVETSPKMSLSHSEEKNPRFGRKTHKEKKEGKIGKHTKNSEDNIIRKIKSFFVKSIHKYLSECLKEGEELLKLDIMVSKDLKKDFNMKLFNQKLKDLFMSTNISDKYRHKNEKGNEILIKKIYSENEEIHVINILNLTFGEAFDLFRYKVKYGYEIDPKNRKKVEGFQDIEAFIYKIYDQEKKKGESEENIKKYIHDIINLSINFEKWFSNKIGRNR
jgi:hypothetical protein